MKTLEVFRFELEYQSKRWWTWAYFAAMLGFSLLIATQGSTQGVQAQGYLYNGPYAMAMLTLVGGFLGLLVTAAFAGDAAARDPETRMAPLFYQQARAAGVVIPPEIKVQLQGGRATAIEVMRDDGRRSTHPRTGDA